MRPVLTGYLFALLTSALLAQTQDPTEIIVVGVVPAGSSLDLNKLPYPVQSASAEDLDEINGSALADFMNQRFASVSINDAQNNPLQRDMQYRGFTVSPLLGLAQGLAVYQNGARINEPLGDAVNWDLLPQSAISQVRLGGGANPLYGLNSLGGSLVIDMKNGFNFQGSNVEISAGSFGRTQASFEAGGNNDTLGYYLNLEHFSEDGWRDQSESEAINLYGSVGWRSDASALNLNLQRGESELIGNGASPIELLEISRQAIFTGPDVTENNMTMLGLVFSHQISSNSSFSGNLFWRRNDSDSFNGDGTEFALCEFTSGTGLIEGLDEDDVEELGIDDDDLCEGQFPSADALEDYLNDLAITMGEDAEFSIESFEDDELSGTGILSEDAINNISNRVQESFGADFQWTLRGHLFKRPGQLVIGSAYFVGDSKFDSVLELADIDPLTRITTGLGTGTYIDEAATDIRTETETLSAYITATVDLSEALALTLSARTNDTSVRLDDLSGERPELNGDHSFNRVNPAVGLTYQAGENHNLYGSYSESSRAPTPIELACNEGVFELAIEFALTEGEDPDDVEFECRLPNAFLADPPLQQVVARSFELGSRGLIGNLNYSISLFRTTNKNDILFQTTGRATGLFANVDQTRREGFEGSIQGQLQDIKWFASYSHVDASFEDDFKVLSPNHQFADDDGEIQVNTGDSIPGIPQHQFKLSAGYQFSKALSTGVDVIHNSDQILRGDESNQLDTVDGYTLINLRFRYQFSEDFGVFALINNVLDSEFETFGLLGEEPGELEVPIIEDLEVPVFLGPAPPRAGFLGIKYRF